MARSLWLVASVLVSCGGGLPRPPSGPVPTDTLEIPYPPPVPRVETIPARGKGDEVWVDGYWDWDGERFRWTSGGWVVPPPRAYFAPWTARRAEDGRLMFTRAGWYDDKGRPLDLEGDDRCRERAGRTGAAPVPSSRRESP